MGGCYGGSYSYAPAYEAPKRKPRSGFQKFLKSGEVEDLIEAQRAFLDENKSGFIAELAKAAGIKEIANIPKEFPDIEYEVKFDLQLDGQGKEEPGIGKLLDAFDFPSSRNARFLKDPVNTSATGVNHFYGNPSDERLVVIEKGGKVYLKEKGEVIQVDVPVKYREVVIKRTERRWESPLEEVINKINSFDNEDNVKYRGKLRKEKGDAFILDTNDGRIYSFTITRAHLIKPNESEESETQRQLEIEYAGHIPGFKSFEKDSERQIVEGMVDLAKYTYALYGNAPIERGWRMNLFLTNERKYDFVIGKKNECVRAKIDFSPLPCKNPKNANKK